MAHQQEGETAEPADLCCPITRVMFRDPVITLAGHTYEREAVLNFWRGRPATDPLSNTRLAQPTLITNWDKRKAVAAWLEAHPDRTPEGWDARDVPPPAATGAPSSGLAPRAGGWGGWILRSLLPPMGLRVPIVVLCVLCALGAGFVCAGPELYVQTNMAPEGDVAAAGGCEAAQQGTLEQLLQAAPAGSAVTIERTTAPKGPQLQVTVPPGGFSFLTLGLALFWNGFVAAWTGIALFSGAPLPFTLFSLPFWGCGGLLARMTFEHAFVTDVLTVGDTHFELRKVVVRGEGRDFEVASSTGLVADVGGVHFVGMQGGHAGGYGGAYPGVQIGGYPGVQIGGYPGVQIGGYPGVQIGGYAGGFGGGYAPQGAQGGVVLQEGVRQHVLGATLVLVEQQHVRRVLLWWLRHHRGTCKASDGEV